MHTEVHRPARTIRLLPIRFTSPITASSSHVFIVVRSKNFALGKTALISSNMGPEKVFSATVVGIVATPKILAALATRAALFLSMIGSIDFVANAICDWKSIKISVWSAGESRVFPGIGFAVGMYTPSIRAKQCALNPGDTQRVSPPAWRQSAAR